MNQEVLIIDDEHDIRMLIKDILEDEGFVVREASSSTEAFEQINKKLPSVIALDIWLQGDELDGLAILEIITKKYPFIPVIMISGHGTIETAIKSLKIGAYDYLEKPFSTDKLVTLIKRACEKNVLLNENSYLKAQKAEALEFVCESNEMLKIRQLVDKVSKTKSRVLIEGETGTGKKLIANLIHHNSDRSKKKLCYIDIRGRNEEDLVLVLFGEMKQWSINASPRKIGAFERADNSTLVIDGIDEMPLSIQHKLLQVLNGNDDMEQDRFDIRLITIARSSLSEKIKEGKFRDDLYSRLSIIHMLVPPLRKRRSDIEKLAVLFLNALTKKYNYSSKRLSENTISLLQSYDWPRNITQLKNYIEWALIMSDNAASDVIECLSLPQEMLENNNDSASLIGELLRLPLKQAREEFEKIYLKNQMTRVHGNITKMSQNVGMERTALHRKLKSMELV